MTFFTKIVWLVVIFNLSEGLHHADYQPQLYQNYDGRHQRISELEVPTSYSRTASPLLNPNKSPEYRSFLTELYRFDRDKSPVTFDTNSKISSSPPTTSIDRSQQFDYGEYKGIPAVFPFNKNRPKRTIIYRPVFNYQQRERKRYRKLTKEEYRKKYLEHFRY